MEYSRLADLPLEVKSVSFQQHSRHTSSGFERVTTTIRLRGDGALGRGEDVTYDAVDHERLAGAAPNFQGLVGSWTYDEFSTALESESLFPTPPERDAAYHYRRWAFESAALDLALRQADTHLGAILDRTRKPVRFVASTRLTTDDRGQATTSRLDALIDRVPDIEFKLDPTDKWEPEVIAAIPADRVRTLDLKGQYQGTTVDQEADPELYRRVLEAFPDAVIEDPAFTETTRPLFNGHEQRVSWDLPITGVASVRDLPFDPAWLNIKPSRFGTVASLMETLGYADEHDITLYGGGQFELGVGRAHIQLFASLFYPTGPNDVAPGVFNDPTLPDRLPTSPLAPSAAPRGLDF